MAHSDTDPAAANAAAPATGTSTEAAAGPAGRELGIREARGQLGELADRARYLDEITYLTKHRTRIAAVVPAEAARSRGQLQGTVEQSAAEAERTRRDYERLHRAADAVLNADEVLWVRAYLRLWDLLQQMDGAFEAALEDALAAERDRADPAEGADDEERWASDDAVYYGDPYLGELRRLRQEERARLDFARQIDQEVESHVEADVRYPGRGEVLDWHAWASRIDKLAHTIAAARAAGADRPQVFGARTRLRDALAEACAMLEDLEVTAPAQPPADVTDYLAREIWTDAAKVPAGPLIVTIAAFVRGSHLPAEAVRRALGELRTAGKISCYRYFRGQQTEIDPTRLIPEAQFHLVLHGQLDGLDLSHIRPAVIVDL
ncbi:type II toxin-antitoxin system Phd/YefM family antitoxin [Nonomuraea sp. NPDC049714]|uniref:type II toxin-antitoxin system Phd/YefM family antitoxin n=1 Tax=Nonomuraea sp. NPDC049714 TaxID=3364357 RepID=UPI0037BD92AE